MCHYILELKSYTVTKIVSIFGDVKILIDKKMNFFINSHPHYATLMDPM